MTKTISSVLVLSLLLALSSCGIKNPVVRADDYDAETIVDYMNEEEPVVPNSAVKPHRHSGAHKNHTVAHTPLDGEWIIVEAAGETIVRDDDMPYIIFSDNEGRFYASNGCNIINGTYKYHDNKTLTFNNVVTTLRECPDIDLQNDISVVLNNGVTVKTKIETKNRESYLYLYTNANDLLLKLRRHNLEVINGKWEVADIGGEEVDGSEINLFFDIPEHTVHGNTGCNYFNGVIVIDPDKDSSISFAQMGVTMRACENADIERQLLVALEETETYTLQDKSTLHLNSAEGERLITLKRAEK